MKYKMIMLTLLAGVLASAMAWADSSLDEVKAAVESLIGNKLPADSIEESAIAGMFVVYANGAVYHVTLKDNVLLVGDAFDMIRGVSLNDEIRNRKLGAAVSGLDPSDMIVFKAADKKRHVTVFTDIDCGYCRRLHQEVPALNAAGLEVRYAAYPRAGVGSSSYDKIVTVWCSDDPQSAMTRAKAGEVLKQLDCSNPVAYQYQVGNSSGVQGTPTLVLDDGMVIGGYVPAEELLNSIGLSGN